METNMLTKGDYSKLSCAVYVQCRRFPHAAGRVFVHVIQHLSLYIILLLCFFSNGALLGKGDPHQTLGWFIQGRSTWYPGVG